MTNGVVSPICRWSQQGRRNDAVGGQIRILIFIVAPPPDSHLKLVGFLQLVCVLVLAVVHLLPLDVGVHPLFLHIRPGEVEVSVCLVVRLHGLLTGPKCLLILLLGLGQGCQGESQLGLDPGTFLEELKNNGVSIFVRDLKTCVTCVTSTRNGYKLFGTLWCVTVM